MECRYKITKKRAVGLMSTGYKERQKNMKDKLLFALQLANVILIVFMLGVQIAELVRTITSKPQGFIRL